MGNGAKIGGVLVAVIIVGAIAFFAMNPQALDQFSVSTRDTPNEQITPSQVAQSGTQVYDNNFDVSTQGNDSLDSNLVYGDDTELTTICWDARGSDDVEDWKKLATSTDTEKGDMDIDVDSATFDTNGNLLNAGLTEMWCEFNLEPSQEFFVDDAEIIDNNDRIDTCIWDDANDDTDDTWICRYNLIGITSGEPNPENAPSDTIDIYLWAEESSDTILDQTVASEGGVTQGDGIESEIETHVDFSDDSLAKIISDVRIRVNVTSDDENLFSGDTEICFEGDGRCLVIDEDFDRDPLTSTIEYTWRAGNDYIDGILLAVDKNDDEKVDTEMTVVTNFESATDALCIELGFKYVDGFGSRSDYDTVDVEVTADSIGDECTL